MILIIILIFIAIVTVVNSIVIITIGPYLSWKGFVGILKDFFIARKPPKRTNIGSKFPEELWEDALPMSSTAPLDMERATTIFIECARTGR